MAQSLAVVSAGRSLEAGGPAQDGWAVTQVGGGLQSQSSVNEVTGEDGRWMG